MNLRGIVCASALTALLASGCARLPDLKNPEVRVQFEGTYQGVLDGNKVTYKVGKEGCVALVDFGLQISHLVDFDCGNTVDLMNLQARKNLGSKSAQAADEVLKYIQHELVKPEYKIK